MSLVLHWGSYPGAYPLLCDHKSTLEKCRENVRKESHGSTRESKKGCINTTLRALESRDEPRKMNFQISKVRHQRPVVGSTTRGKDFEVCSYERRELYTQAYRIIRFLLTFTRPCLSKKVGLRIRPRCPRIWRHNEEWPGKENYSLEKRSRLQYSLPWGKIADKKRFVG